MARGSSLSARIVWFKWYLPWILTESHQYYLVYSISNQRCVGMLVSALGFGK
jgi:hypothetical protein